MGHRKTVIGTTDRSDNCHIGPRHDLSSIFAVADTVSVPPDQSNLDAGLVTCCDELVPVGVDDELLEGVTVGGPCVQ